jgi:hypothetical protein
MKSHDLEKRIAAALRQRLRAAPAALRAMAMAETVAWQAPAFAGDDGQQAAMHALLRACVDARAAIFGRSAADAPGDEERAPQAPRKPQRSVASERLLALERAIAAAIRAGRMLRQRGLKPTITTNERADLATGEIILTRAELGFRPRVADRRAA